MLVWRCWQFPADDCGAPLVDGDSVLGSTPQLNRHSDRRKPAIFECHSQPRCSNHGRADPRIVHENRSARLRRVVDLAAFRRGLTDPIFRALAATLRDTIEIWCAADSDQSGKGTRGVAEDTDPCRAR
jgi:hypothetical protein